MAVKSLFGGLASLGLMLAQILLCLLFVLYDRLVQRLSGDDVGKRAGEAL